jgi:hypothetical protein
MRKMRVALPGPAESRLDRKFGIEMDFTDAGMGDLYNCFIEIFFENSWEFRE